MDPFDFDRGELPLLVSFPHSGTWTPKLIVQTMTDSGKAVPDTDWFLPRLYDFPALAKASRLAANFSRYVIDPNRPPDGTNLYPGQPTPRLCPLQTFAGEEIYESGCQPEPREIERRKQLYWQPYHQQLQRTLAQMVKQFGFAVLFDAHSIRSHVPRLFSDQLPDINIGTAKGQSCDPSLETMIEQTLKRQVDYTYVMNGRFIGGHITRSYGDPVGNQVSSVQLELSQVTYMDEQTGLWDDAQAKSVQPVLESFLQTLIAWVRQRLENT